MSRYTLSPPSRPLPRSAAAHRGGGTAETPIEMGLAELHLLAWVRSDALTLAVALGRVDAQLAWKEGENRRERMYKAALLMLQGQRVMPEARRPDYVDVAAASIVSVLSDVPAPSRQMADAAAVAELNYLAAVSLAPLRRSYDVDGSARRLLIQLIQDPGFYELPPFQRAHALAVSAALAGQDGDADAARRWFLLAKELDRNVAVRAFEDCELTLSMPSQAPDPWRNNKTGG